MELSGAPALYANIPITNIKNDILVEKKKETEALKEESTDQKEEAKEEIIASDKENTEEINEPMAETVN